MIEYLNYKNLKEFYTIPETCEIFGLAKEVLKAKCEEYRIKPVRNEQGEGGFRKYTFRMLHNALYREDRKNRQEWDPWA